MSKRRYPIICAWCGKPGFGSRREVKTCSRSCGCTMRDYLNPRKGKKREYPPALVEEITKKYQSGMTITEIQAETSGVKVQNVLERYGVNRRVAAKRHQSGELNHMWKGDKAGYEAAHWRVKNIHGSARYNTCVDCGENAHDWSYDGLDPNEQQCPDNGCWYSLEPNHYQSRCRSCHRQYDKKIREMRIAGGDANVQEVEAR